MNEITSSVKGSSAEPYTVRFVKQSSGLSAYCSCPAGAAGQYCKHRMRILNGDEEGIVSDNRTEVVLVKSWLVGTTLEVAIQEVARSEQELDKLKTNLSIAKKKLSRLMLHT